VLLRLSPADTLGAMPLAPVHVAANEIEAEIVCSYLRDCGIPCTHRRRGLSAVRRVALDIGGKREVMVEERDLDDAREALAGLPEL